MPLNAKDMTGSSVLMCVDDEFRPLLLTGDQRTVASAVMGWAEAGLTVRVVRGRKMRNLPGLFDEFSAALQFPLYFGENEDAFDECIADLENLPAGEGYVVTITEPDQVLVEDAASLGWLVLSLSDAAEEWSRPVELGEWWDRAAVPFHVVLAGELATVLAAERRWTEAGAEPRPIEGPRS
jgi:Barstar (barnase inhibitor).